MDQDEGYLQKIDFTDPQTPSDAWPGGENLWGSNTHSADFSRSSIKEGSLAI